MLGEIPSGSVLNSSPMFKNYFQNLTELGLHPARFFERDFGPAGEKESIRFAVLTGVLVALELGISEALGGGSLGIVALVTGLTLLGMPFFVTLWIYLWAGFMKLCAYLLGENFPLQPVRQVVGFSVAGMIPLGIGFGFGKWLALASFPLQVLGVEKALRCSRWTALVYVGLPFSMLAVLGGFFFLMFKVFK